MKKAGAQKCWRVFIFLSMYLVRPETKNYRSILCSQVAVRCDPFFFLSLLTWNYRFVGTWTFFINETLYRRFYGFNMNDWTHFRAEYLLFVCFSFGKSVSHRNWEECCWLVHWPTKRKNNEILWNKKTTAFLWSMAILSHVKMSHSQYELVLALRSFGFLSKFIEMAHLWFNFSGIQMDTYYVFELEIAIIRLRTIFIWNKMFWIWPSECLIRSNVISTCESKLGHSLDVRIFFEAQGNNCVIDGSPQTHVNRFKNHSPATATFYATKCKINERNYIHQIP